MNRPLILGSVGGVIVAIALALTFYVDKEPGSEATAVLKSRPSAPGLPVSDTPRSPTIVPPGSLSDNPVAGSGKAGITIRPSFDVVRVNPRGDAVIAGRAAPNADVIVRDGEREVGKAKADARGEWVVVPKTPLSTGSRELTLSASSGSAAPAKSDENVVIVVPERGAKSGRDDSGRPPAPLAILVPRAGDGASTVLQRPGDAGASQMAPASSEGSSAADISTATGSGEPGTRSDAVPLSIDAVDYDDAGHVTISGRADPEARLHVYIENEFAGAGSADQSGRWRLVPGGELSAGLYTLRVDQVNPAGKVLGRVATQFARSTPANAIPGNAVVFVEPGNSLWRIARRVYGKGIRYSVIYDANREQIRDPDLIYPGQVFFVPHVN